jgi:hypothetical protein
MCHRHKHKDAIKGQAAARELHQAHGDVIWQGWRASDIESKFNGRRDLIDVLAARPCGTDKPLADFIVGQGDISGDLDHGAIFRTLTEKASAVPSCRSLCQFVISVEVSKADVEHPSPGQQAF